MSYEPLKIDLLDMAGAQIALHAMRLPKQQNTIPTHNQDLRLASRLIKAGDDHAKALRGAIVWYRMECQVGWLIEYVTYRQGVECLSSSSAMHTELASLTGDDLARQKQIGLPAKVYTRVEVASYQALRRMYLARKNHRHPDWAIFCEWIEKVPYFNQLIYPEAN